MCLAGQKETTLFDREKLDYINVRLYAVFSVVILVSIYIHVDKDLLFVLSFTQIRMHQNHPASVRFG
jgi:hypothetical protein